MPFAIIGSEEEIEIDGQPVRARIYPWGIAEVDNPKHSDFSRLRSALLKYISDVLRVPGGLLSEIQLAPWRLEVPHPRRSLRDVPY